MWTHSHIRPPTQQHTWHLSFVVAALEVSDSVVLLAAGPVSLRNAISCRQQDWSASAVWLWRTRPEPRPLWLENARMIWRRTAPAKCATESAICPWWVWMSPSVFADLQGDDFGNWLLPCVDHSNNNKSSYKVQNLVLGDYSKCLPPHPHHTTHARTHARMHARTHAHTHRHPHTQAPAHTSILTIPSLKQAASRGLDEDSSTEWKMETE